MDQQISVSRMIYFIVAFVSVAGFLLDRNTTVNNGSAVVLRTSCGWVHNKINPRRRNGKKRRRRNSSFEMTESDLNISLILRCRYREKKMFSNFLCSVRLQRLDHFCHQTKSHVRRGLLLKRRHSNDRFHFSNFLLISPDTIGNFPFSNQRYNVHSFNSCIQTIRDNILRTANSVGNPSCFI